MQTILKYCLISLIVFFDLSCLYAKSPNEVAPVEISCDSCVLFLGPTLEQIDRIKLAYSSEQDFYVMADDANYYTASAIDYLENKGIEPVFLDAVKVVVFNDSESFDFTDLAWDFVLYKRNSAPKIAHAIDLIHEFGLYFKDECSVF